MNTTIKNGENYIKAEALLMELNEAVGTDSYSLIAKSKKALSEVIDKINDEIKKDIFANLLAQENTALEAIKLGSIELMSIKQDSKSNEFEFSEKMVILDLSELQENEGKKQIFANPQGIYWMESLNHAIYAMKCEQTQITEKSKRLSSFKISRIAKTLELESVTTKGGATNAIQKVLDACLYVPMNDKKGKEVNTYKVDGRHITTILENYTKWSNSSINGIVFPSDSTFRQMLMRIFHCIVTDKKFIAE